MHFVAPYPLVDVDPTAELLTQESIASIADIAEQSGFSAFSLTEHPATPQYWRDGHGHDAIDPFVGLAFAAAVTRRIRLLTYLTVVPYHQPFVLAKTVATLDRLSGGRMLLGVGTGYLRGEFKALGVDFDQRNALFDESIEVMRSAWTGLPVDYESERLRAKSVVSRPQPVSRPHPPIWIGGNSALTRRRVAQYAQGWMPIPTSGPMAQRRRTAELEDLDQLAAWIRQLRQRRDELGRLGEVQVSYMVQDIDARQEPDRYLDRIHRLAEIGVGWVPAEVPGRSRAEAENFLRWFGAEVISQVGDRVERPVVDADRREIVELYQRYCDLLDRDEWDRLGEVFTPEVEAHYGSGPVVDGLPALTSFLRTAHAELAKTRHRVLDVEIEIDRDEAVVRVAKRNDLCRGDAEESVQIIAGRYEDRLIRTPDGWRVARRRSTLVSGT